MNIAIVGCGFISSAYIETLVNHPNLQLKGVYDHVPDRMEKVSQHYKVRQFDSLEEILNDPSIEIVVTLTNPRSHYEVNKQCLEAGKHVYSEKPLTIELEHAKALVNLAQKKGLLLASAPCSMLGETAQTIGQMLRRNLIGKVRLVYASYEGGMAHRGKLWQRNINPVGVVWPAKDEFETGCTFEHAGYYLNWLAAFFGPAQRVTAYSSCQLPDKEISVDKMAPDFSVGMIEYNDNVVARVTHGLIAPFERSITIVGDNGVIRADESSLLGSASPVFLIPQVGMDRPPMTWRRVVQGVMNRAIALLPGMVGSVNYDRVNPARKATFKYGRGQQRVDRCLGIAELAEAIETGRPCRLSTELALHVTELMIALQHPDRCPSPYVLQSTFAPIAPMPWAET